MTINHISLRLICALVFFGYYSEGTAIPRSSKPPPGLETPQLLRRAAFDQGGCSQDQLSVMQSALINCADLANKAAEFALNGDAKYMQSYFGSADQQIREKIAENYRIIANDCSTGAGGRAGDGNSGGSAGGQPLAGGGQSGQPPSSGPDDGNPNNFPSSPYTGNPTNGNAGSPFPGNFPTGPYTGNPYNGPVGYPPLGNYPNNPYQGYPNNGPPPQGGNLFSGFPWFRRLLKRTPTPTPQYGETPYPDNMLSPINNGVSSTVFLCNFREVPGISAQQNPCQSGGALAYTALGLNPVTINPCPTFYGLDDTPRDCRTMDKATVLIHEISHAIFGTRDEPVQQGTIKVYHSYAYNYFAHGVALQCLDNGSGGPGYGITSDH